MTRTIRFWGRYLTQALPPPGGTLPKHKANDPGGRMNDSALTPTQSRQIEEILQDAHAHGLTQAQVQHQIDRVLASTAR
ncbi:MAG TPA: hypothetical protein VMF61_16485 [Candidatus Acidoferrales bacterium]|nr:hypothetical protein [Candidatus Acidoferrales bacterium]